MKLCFYSDYVLTSRGGGERHLLKIALSAARSHEVTIAVPDIESTQIETLKQELEQLVGESLDGLKLEHSPGKHSSHLARLKWFGRFNGIFWVCDGSLPLLINQKKYLHIQIPFTNTHSSIVSRAKLNSWSAHANTNSLFTKSVVEKAWNTSLATVLWPAVDTDFSQFHSTTKKPMIVSIGRFFTHLHSKRQDVLIQAFAQLQHNHAMFHNYELILIGDVEDEAYVQKLRKQAKHLPITFVHQTSRERLKQYLAESTFYWHATGFEVDVHVHPEQVEHFGISVAESMAAGCIPLVVGKGGMAEVLGNELFSDCTWSSIDECVNKTTHLTQHAELQSVIRTKAQLQVQKFNQTSFDQRVATYFSDSYYNRPRALHESN